MSRMMDLIRRSEVPANLMRAAAHGALSLPPGEMLEVLVYLSAHPIFGAQARLTLAGWDQASARAVLADPQVAPEAFDYFAAPENQRADLLPALLENPALGEERLLRMAQEASREVLAIMLASPRVCTLPAVMQALLANPEITDEQSGVIKRQLEHLSAPPAEQEDDLLDAELSQYLGKCAPEIAAAEGEQFHLIGWTAEEQAEVTAAQAKANLNVGAAAQAKAGLNVSTAAARALGTSGTREHLSTVQKIARMNAGERVQLALKGNKDERSVLIRDGARVVSSAILESPKVTDSEIEAFAAMKNVSEHVLRGIANKRKFMRSYVLKRILTANPRCPIDVALPLVKELLVIDLRNLSMNKNVSDTVRRFAYKTWKEKTTVK